MRVSAIDLQAVDIWARREPINLLTIFPKKTCTLHKNLPFTQIHNYQIQGNAATQNKRLLGGKCLQVLIFKPLHKTYSQLLITRQIYSVVL